METDKYKIGFIASGKKQIQNALATIQDESVEFRVVRAGLDEAIPIGKNMEEEGFEAILAYRGTAAILRENQTVPVITIPFTYLDVILSLKEAASLGEKIPFTAFRGDKEGLETLEELIKRRILTGNFDDSYSMEESVMW